ncbi:hypothetical protein CI102_4006 [Trichoderma harzianum]|uniref:2EXR domain-containing protein n=1 Tax=Trichoderma harzianum CBS 226.95 TaxID=983964 RepID=A0A2T3ZX64_TRIHA|nr:hypothetical protein M431DRAFT_273597 [Trichoderma harzianum CBS 226.95]PKK52449.1 hypothetical protein CI102_4006 [Trichoderma harzianum]PTB49400.1 hypothetical protein M431DRAFT_273597 [Trichoderma harzianum CBS 226.95]
MSTTFHLFPLLPAEIRSAIYNLATPPRVVFVHQQVESFEDFKARLPHITIAERNVRPDVDYASFYELLRQASATLRHHRRKFFKQTKLEAYGFTNNKKAGFSWEFESMMPFDTLMHYPRLAFPMYRKTIISCQAAIPPLLHTCSESRSLLISYGYELAFPSTAQDPQVWFNFGRDILLLDDDFDCEIADPYTYGPQETEIERIPHTFHHFRPRDVDRLQRLALTNHTHYSRMFLGHKLCPKLKELILVEWDAEESEQALRQSVVDPALLRPVPNIQQAYHKGEQLCILPVEEVDALWTTLELGVFGAVEDWHPAIREDAWDLKQHKRDNGFHIPFIKEKLRQMKEEYVQRRKSIEYYNKEFYKPYQKFPAKEEEYPPWSIHQLSFAHICTPHTATRIMATRLTFMEQFTKLRAEALHANDEFELPWIKQHRLPPPFVLQKYSNWPAVNESRHSTELEWWIKNGLPIFDNSLPV